MHVNGAKTEKGHWDLLHFIAWINLITSSVNLMRSFQINKHVQVAKCDFAWTNTM